jgi:hypothetical protein
VCKDSGLERGLSGQKTGQVVTCLLEAQGELDSMIGIHIGPEKSKLLDFRKSFIFPSIILHIYIEIHNSVIYWCLFPLIKFSN